MTTRSLLAALLALWALTGCDKIQELVPGLGGDEEAEAETAPAEAAPAEAEAATAEAAPAEAAPAEAEAAEAAPAEAAPAEAGDADEPATAEAEEPAVEAEPEEPPAAQPTAAQTRRPAAERPASERPARPSSEPTRRAQVTAAVRAAAQRCFSNTEASGSISVRVSVGNDGRVYAGRVTENGTGDQEVARCISGALVGRRFSAPPEPSGDNYDVAFQG